MLKIAICDDDVHSLESIYKMVTDFIKEKPETEFSVSCFQSSRSLLQCIEFSQGFHIYLLDIIIPDINGIDIGAKIREGDENAVIIYLTTSPDYAIKSYSVSAFHYLIKPVTGGQLYPVLEKASKKIDLAATQSLPVKTKKGVTAVRFHWILFAEYKNHSVNFHLSDGSVLTGVTSREPFDTMIGALMKDPRFIKPHASFLANMYFVSTITAKDFVMTNDFLIPISRKCYSEIKKRYIDFLLEGAVHSKC